MDEHKVARVNEGWYVCDVCGQTGSEQWANFHQFRWPDAASIRNVIGTTKGNP